MTYPCSAIFGEIIFDRFADHVALGGAPLNVAWYLHQLGLPAALVSAVGADELAARARDFMTTAGMEQTYILDRPEPTGAADVSFVDGEPTFSLQEASAWDHIELPPDHGLTPELVYYGTAARRTLTNRDSLRRLLDLEPRHRLYDPNLREPHYTDELVLEGLALATAVKLSAHEWEIASRLTGLGSPPDLLDRFGLDLVAVTRGAEGAELYAHGESLRSPGHPVASVNPVGAGDAFSGILAAGLLRNVDPDKMLEAACAAGAAVVQQEGAQVSLPEDVQRLLT